MERSASWTLDRMREQCARIRMLCDALGIEPEDCRLEDLHPLVKRKLLQESEDDLWKILNQ